MRTIPEYLRGVFTMKRYTNLYLPLPYLTIWGGMLLPSDEASSGPNVQYQ